MLPFPGRLLAGALVASCLAAEPPSPVPVPVVSLATYPQRVFKARDTGNQPLESWYFALQVRSECPDVTPTRLRIRLFAGQTLLETQELSTEALASMRQLNFAGELFDLPILASRPLAWGTDRIDLELDVESEGVTQRAAHSVALSSYAQQTTLIFPFRGRGLVTQGPFHDRGHYGPSNHFALDVIGLTDLYAPQLSDEESNASCAGWQREILAPADGVVVRARGDIPNNPGPGASLDPAVLAGLPDPEPQFTVPGNHIVIDHGNSEFSVLMHLDFGSVRVKAGDIVEQGDVIARLGNSGDSFGPHLHYQLQAGPQVFVADPLPVEFSNLPGKRLVRGSCFHAQ